LDAAGRRVLIVAKGSGSLTVVSLPRQLPNEKQLHQPSYADSMDKSQPFVYKHSRASPVIVCFTPKVGSTSWKLLLAKGLGIPRYPDKDGYFRVVGSIALPYRVPSGEW